MPTRSRKRRTPPTRPKARTRRPGARAQTAASRTTTRQAKGSTPAPRARHATAVSGLAPGMQAVNVYLAVANVAATVEFLERTFGFARGVVLPDAHGQPRYAEMRHGTSVIMLTPKGDAAGATGGAAGLYTYVADVDRALLQARAAGAGAAEAEDKPWGDRTGVVTDPDGYRWVLATFKKLAPFQGEGERRKGGDRRRKDGDGD